MTRSVQILAILTLTACAVPPEQPTTPASMPEFRFEFLDFIAADPDAEPPLPATVKVKILKHDPDAGTVSWSGFHREGATLGWSRVMDQPTSLHEVYSARLSKVVLVDFDSNVVLQRVVVGKPRAGSVLLCPIFKEPMAMCPGPAKAECAYIVDEATYVTEAGKETTYQRGTVTGPDEDTLCPAHGNKGSASDLRALRSREAKTLFLESAESRLSKNPKLRKQARDAYRRLLTEFSNEEIVTKNLDLIKARAEAEIAD